MPTTQTCCGQPAFNSGDAKDAAALAQQVIEAFEPYDYVVAPSGSCAGMIRVHYPRRWRAMPAWAERAEALAAKTHEIMSFLADVRGYRPKARALARRRPITTAAPACANSASSPSRASCLPPSTGSRCAS